MTRLHAFVPATLAMALLVVSAGGCATHTGNGALIGGAGGAALGAAIGSTSHARAGEGALIGGILGALVGGAIGDDMDRQERGYYEPRYDPAPGYYESPRYYGPEVRFEYREYNYCPPPPPVYYESRYHYRYRHRH